MTLTWPIVAMVLVGALLHANWNARVKSSRWHWAAASLGSYGIALWAMTHAPVATVAALRETSVLFAALLGASLLKEKFTRRRVVGTLTIVAGVMALRWA